MEQTRQLLWQVQRGELILVPLQQGYLLPAAIQKKSLESELCLLPRRPGLQAQRQRGRVLHTTQRLGKTLNA